MSYPASHILFDALSGCGRVVVNVPRAFWESDWRSRLFPESNPEYVQAMVIDGVAFPPKTDAGVSGLFYHYEVASREGARFTLFREPHHTDADVRAAKSYIRRGHDVTKLTVFTIVEWLDERKEAQNCEP